MKKNRISISIMLIAGIIVSVIGTINQFTVIKLLTTMVVVLLIFFIVGKIFQNFLGRIMRKVDSDNNKSGINGENEQISDKTQEKNKEKKELNLENSPNSDNINSNNNMND